MLCFFFPYQIADVQVQVSQNTEALQGAQVEKSDLSRQIQTLEIELASQQSLVSPQNIFYTFLLYSQIEVIKSVKLELHIIYSNMSFCGPVFTHFLTSSTESVFRRHFA